MFLLASTFVTINKGATHACVRLGCEGEEWVSTKSLMAFFA